MALLAPKPVAVRQRSAASRRAAARAVAHRRILVPLVGGQTSEQAVAIASQLAAEHGASITALTVIEIPPELPMDAHMIDEEALAKRVLGDAQAIAERYGVNVATRVIRARDAGEAIVESAGRAETEIIVLRALRRQRAGRRAPIFGRTVRFVLKHAPCRVMVAALPPGG